MAAEMVCFLDRTERRERPIGLFVEPIEQVLQAAAGTDVDHRLTVALDQFHAVQPPHVDRYQLDIRANYAR
jgi:hypothetical protein